MNAVFLCSTPRPRLRRFRPALRASAGVLAAGPAPPQVVAPDSPSDAPLLGLSANTSPDALHASLLDAATRKVGDPLAFYSAAVTDIPVLFFRSLKVRLVLAVRQLCPNECATSTNERR
jgi:hypothetical protein